MKGLNLASTWLRTANPSSRAIPIPQWTCRSCTQKATRRTWNQGQNSRYSTGSRRSYTYGNNGRRKGVLTATALGGATLTGLAFTDDVRHAYEAVERSGRVLSTLFVCINE
jgi:aarF domain-containing kinase